MKRTHLISPLTLSAGLLLCFGTAVRGADQYLIDFGIADGNAAQGAPTANPDSSGNYWNNVTSTSVGFGVGGGTGLTLANLVTSTNAASTVSLTMSGGWKSAGIGNGGLNQVTPALGTYGVQTVTEDYWYVEGANGNSTSTQTVTVSNLNPSKVYDFTMFGTRNATGAPLIRGTQYSVTDANGVHSIVLQNSGTNLGGTGYNGNNSTVATLSSLVPAADGSITLSVANLHDSGIYTANQFGYLGLLGIKEGTPAGPPAPPIVRVDFGIADGNAAQGAPTPSPDSLGNYWNNVTSTTVGTNIAGGTGTTLSNLVSTKNVLTNLALSLGAGWKSSGIANGGLVSPSAASLGEFAIPTATEDYYYVEGTNAAANITISGLNPGKLYNFRLFGTRDTTTVRHTTYTVTAGNGTFASTLQTSGPGLGNGGASNGNTSTIAALTGIQCDSNAAVILTVSVTDGGFAHLGVLEIAEGDSVTPLPPVDPPTPNLVGEVNRWTAQDALDPVAPGSVVFCGSSSIRRWESLTRDFADYKIVQRGWGGTQFSDLNPVVNQIVTPYQPSAIVVFEGTNDIRVSHKSADTVFADFKTFVANVRTTMPLVPICYLGITPCPSFFVNPADDPSRRQVDTMIANYCASDPSLHLFFFPTNTFFDNLHDTDPATWATYFVDDTHLNRAGYAQWLSVVRPALMNVLAPNKTFSANLQTLVSGEKLLFDFGPKDASAGDPTTVADVNGNLWNNWYGTDADGLVNSGEHKPNLVRTTGTGTGIRMTITAGFQGSGKTVGGGLFAPASSFLGDLAVESATEDYWYSTANDKNDATNDDLPGGFMLDGLNPALSYDFRFLGSRRLHGNPCDRVRSLRGEYPEGEPYHQRHWHRQRRWQCQRQHPRHRLRHPPGPIRPGLRRCHADHKFPDAPECDGDRRLSACFRFQSWRSAHFTAAELADPSLEATVWGANADPDHDGRTNLMEYALGTSPKVPDIAAMTTAVESNGSQFSLSYPKQSSATDIVYQVQSSTDLATWASVSDTSVSSSSGVEIRKATVPTAGVPKRFLRLSVQLTP